MSEFISSFTESVNPKPKMKFHANLHKNQWSFYPLPFAYIYFETCNPDSHVPFLKNKMCGVYLSFNWLKHTYNIGLHKTID